MTGQDGLPCEHDVKPECPTGSPRIVASPLHAGKGRWSLDTSRPVTPDEWEMMMTVIALSRDGFVLDPARSSEVPRAWAPDTMNAHDAIAESLKGFGGFLRCEHCGKRSALDDDMDVRNYLRDGWPRHCGYTMRWWTQRQVLAGEVPPMADRTSRVMVESDDLRQRAAPTAIEAALWRAWNFLVEENTDEFISVPRAFTRIEQELIAAGLVATPTPPHAELLTREEVLQVVDIVDEHMQTVKHPEWHQSCKAIAQRLRAWAVETDG